MTSRSTPASRSGSWPASSAPRPRKPSPCANRQKQGQTTFMPRLASAELSAALELLDKGNWQAAHEIVQKDEESPLACWAHGIVHLMEGDVANARYWYGAAGRAFPAHPSVASEIRELRAAFR